MKLAAPTAAISPARLLKGMLGVVSVVLLGTALRGSVLPGGSKTKSEPLQLEIANTSSSGTPYAVTNDGQGYYIDHTLSGNLENTCVNATLSSNGFTQVSLNYLVNQKKSIWCNPSTEQASPGFIPRSWSMVIDDSTACSILLGADASSPCTFTVPTTADERILPGDIFSSTATQVIFQWTGYSVQIDGNAAVSGTGSVRTATYSGTAKLYQSGTAVSGSFPFSFQLVITLN